MDGSKSTDYFVKNKRKESRKEKRKKERKKERKKIKDFKEGLILLKIVIISRKPF